MKKNIKIITLIALTIGITLTILGIIKLTTNKTTDNKPQDENFPIELIDFTIDNSVKNQVNMTLKIKNNTEKTIKNEILYLNFYNNENYLLHTYEHNILELKSNYEIEINAIIPFIYQTISKYEFVYQDNKLIKTPIFNKLKN